MIKKAKNKIVYYLKYSHNWLFDSGTRCIEVFNAIALIGFSLIFFINNSTLIKLPSFRQFALITPPYYWFLLFVLGVFCLLALCLKSLRSNQISGYLIMVSGVIWAIISLGFTMENFDGITTAPMIYGLIAIFCMLAGTRLLLVNKALEESICNNSK